MAKVTVITQYNRFDNTQKDVKIVEYKKQTALELKKNLPVPVETDIILNGEIIRAEDTTWIMPGDNVTLVPRIGGDFFRTILPLVLIVAATLIFPGSGFLMVAARIGFVVAGSLLINAILPPPKPHLPSLDFNSSQTYQWNSRTSDQPNTPIPLIYGQMKTHGTIISSYLSNDGSKNYLNMLISFGEGVINSISDMKINGQPIYQYDNVKAEVRLGNATQTAITGFSTTKKEYIQGITVLETTPFLYTTLESDFDSMEVDIVFPQGLWYANDGGGLDNNTVHYRVSYSIDSGTTYNAVTSSTSTVVNTEIGRAHV